MRIGAVSVVTCLALAVTAIGCVDHEPHSANDVAEADAFLARQSARALRGAPEAGDATAAGKVRCRCDADGGLHVQAPQGSNVVQVSEETAEDAEVEITFATQASARPIRQTVSLGFIGDNKLNEAPSGHGDALLPPHRQGLPDRPHNYGSSHGYRGYAGNGYGGAAPSGGNHRVFSPSIPTSVRSGRSFVGGRSSGGRAMSSRAPR